MRILWCIGKCFCSRYLRISCLNPNRIVLDRLAVEEAMLLRHRNVVVAFPGIEMIDEQQTICPSKRLALNNLIGNRRIRNIFLTLDSRANRFHDGFQGFHAADKRTGPCYFGLVHHELAPGNSGYQTVANRLDIARGQRAFHSDRLETPRIYTPATRNGSLDVNRQCIRSFGNVQLAVSRRNAVFVFHADSAVLFHAGCVDGLD